MANFPKKINKKNKKKLSFFKKKFANAKKSITFA